MLRCPSPAKKWYLAARLPDDDHVLPAVGRECRRDLGHHGIRRQGRRQRSHEAGLQALLIDSMWRAISDASRL